MIRLFSLIGLNFGLDEQAIYIIKIRKIKYFIIIFSRWNETF
jgi:hypothetical protein